MSRRVDACFSETSFTTLTQMAGPPMDAIFAQLFAQEADLANPPPALEMLPVEGAEARALPFAVVLRRMRQSALGDGVHANRGQLLCALTMRSFVMPAAIEAQHAATPLSDADVRQHVRAFLEVCLSAPIRTCKKANFFPEGMRVSIRAPEACSAGEQHAAGFCAQ